MLLCDIPLCDGPFCNAPLCGRTVEIYVDICVYAKSAELTGRKSWLLDLYSMYMKINSMCFRIEPE